MKDKVYIYDYLLILALQLFENDIYIKIKNNKETFSKFYEEYLINPPSFNNEKLIFKEILESTNRISEENLKIILHKLFPKTQCFTEETSNSMLNKWFSNLDEMYSKKCICSPKVFDRYFTLNLDYDEINHMDFQDLIKLNNVNDIKKSILRIDDEGKTKSLLKSFNSNSNPILKNKYSLFLNAFMDIGDSLHIPTDNTILLKEDSKEKLIHNTIFQLLKYEDSIEKRFEKLKDAIDQSNHSLFTIIYEVHKLINDENELIPDFQLESLKKLVVNKIKEWDEKEILNHDDIYDILKKWESWGEKEDVNNFVKKITAKDDNLLIFLEKFIKPNRNTLDKFENFTKFFVDFNLLSKCFDLVDLKKKNSKYGV